MTQPTNSAQQDHRWVIGSAPECDLHVDCDKVSRRHCELRRIAGEFLLRDLNSTNGTFLDGRRIGSERTVSRNDRITLGTEVAMPWPADAIARPTLGKRTIRVGRAPDNDIVLRHETISAHHVRVEVDGQTIRVVDLGSSNGTGLNSPDNCVEAAVVQATDAIYLGSTRVPVSELVNQPPSGVELEHTVLGSNARLAHASWLTALISGSVMLLVVGFVLLPVRSATPNDPANTSAPALSHIKSNDVEVSVNDQGPDLSNASDSVTKADMAAARPSSISLSTNRRSDSITENEPAGIDDAFFSIAARARQTDAVTHVATAWSVDAHTLVTSATVVQAIVGPLAPDFKIRIENRRHSELTILEMKCHPSFLLARQRVDSIDQEAVRYMKSQPQPETADAEVDEFLYELERRRLEALARMAQYDVALIKVRESMGTHLSVATDGQELRPEHRLRLMGRTRGRLQSTAPSQESYVQQHETHIWRPAGQANATTETDGLFESVADSECILDGCPILDDQNRVIGIFSRPAPLSPIPGKAFIDATLASRVAEFLNN